MGTHVQEEILMDILSRLPVKSLVRFKCVSESWNTLISEPYFKKKHLNHAKNQPTFQKMLFLKWSNKDDTFHFYCSSLSLVQLVKDIPRFDCPSNFDLANGVKLYSSCDGLSLIGIWSKPDREQPSILLIWNPSTGESIILPHSKLLKQLGYNDDDDDWGSTYGLAYDSTSDDYKVLRIDISRDDNANEIMTLKSGSWRRIDKTSGKAVSCLLFGGEYLAVVHGAFHWLGILSRFCVVSFNISYEVYGEIPLPEILCSLPSTYLNRIHFDGGVSELGGMLYVWYKYDNTFSLWAMKDYGVKESWMKLFSITSIGFRDITPIYKFSDDKVLLSMRVNLTIRIVNRIISIGSFGISNRRWPLDCDDIDGVTIDEDGIAYTESLISPRVGL
ncbi:F-box/kelch-repeat protein At3g06240 [Nicotiana tabacum]|uniref:F-box/kelch-repeat protein At3g06240 n=1 Tax=Nicotiana tabacum TaxID=4097 RepID=A0A1S4AB44_TOBAC|nr:PREDICTED: F-box/kelch-repeat protein At3g06240-like [Nicotiana tabacum]